MGHEVPLARTLSPLLRGKIDGRHHFGLLCAAMSGVRHGETVVLDFDGIEDVSASWILAAATPLMSWAATPAVELYPVYSGVLGREGKWEDEFELVANQTGAVFLAVESAGRARMLGSLDAILVDTLRAVQRHGEVTGAGLKRLVPDEAIGATAWSNRLKDLHTKRLLRRTTRGREQVYTTVLEVDFDGPAGAGVAGRQLPAAGSA